MKNKESEDHPQIERRQETIKCPRCDQIASRITWNIGRLSLWSISCQNPECGYQDNSGYSFLSFGRQN